jgi:glycosyltransferase involved in cell wall biosynthesis
MKRKAMAASNRQVLVVAPGRNGRGGIDSVVRLHQSTHMWDGMCTILSTYDDRSSLKKIWAAVKAYTHAPFALLNVQIVHIHLAGQISLLRKLPIQALANVLHKRVILHIHAASEESLFQKTPRWAWKFAFDNADRVIALSPSWAEIIRRNTEHSNIIVLPNPVKMFSSAPRKVGLSPRVLYVGKLESRKGFDTLIAAAAIVLRDFPKAEFWFAGHGELKEASEQASQLGISSQVRLLGWVSAEELERIYDHVDLFCLPSHNEGVPMSVLEAMSHGLPVICTPVGGIPDVVKDGSNGMFVEPGNADSIANMILRLLREPELAASLADAGHKTVQDTCKLELVVNQLEAIYLDLGATTSTAVAEVLHGV